MIRKYYDIETGEVLSAGGMKPEHQQQPDQFIEKHMTAIMDKSADVLIDLKIQSMFGGLDMASVQYFIETGTVNGGLREKIKSAMMLFAAQWHHTASKQQPKAELFTMEQKEEQLDEYLCKVLKEDVRRSCQLFLYYIAKLAIGANSETTALSSEMDVDGKRYKVKASVKIQKIKANGQK